MRRDLKESSPKATAESPPLTTGRVYAEYERLIQSVEKWISSANPQVVGCEDLQVRARIVQRVVELTLDEYVGQMLRGIDAAHRGVVLAHGVRICTDTGRVTLSAKLWLMNMAYFTLNWLHMFASLLLALLGRAPETSQQAVILMEAPGGVEESDDSFVRFCREGPIGILASAKPLIVITKRPPSSLTNSSIIYERRPVVGLIHRCVPRNIRINMMLTHLAGPWRFFCALRSCPVTVLLGLELSLVPLVRELDRRQLIGGIVITTSFFTAQPLWMKGLKDQRFNLHMLWYSQNCIPKMYRGEKYRANLPPMRHMRLDVSWVWTEGFAAYLRELGQRSVMQVVGPILWYLPASVPSYADGFFKIALFDVTPLPDGVSPFGAFKNYYSVATISRFVSDTLMICDEIEAASGKPVLVLLKHKRAPKSGQHSHEYLNFLDSLARVRPNFRLVNHQTNVYGLLEQCDLSISVPYTSTAYVAASLGKHGLFYDPGGELVPMHERNEHVYFAGGEDELRDLISRFLKVPLVSK